MMKRFILIPFLMLLLISTSKAKEPAYVYPTDTMQQFIKAYGKDSLIKILDKTINESVGFLIDNWKYQKIDNFTIEFILAARHFGLGFDTLPLPEEKSPGSIPFYYLYDEGYGDTLKVTPIMRGHYNEVKSGSLKPKIILDSYGKLHYDALSARNALTNYCYVFGEDLVPHADSILNYYDKTSSDKGLGYLLNFATLVQKCDKVSPTYYEGFSSIFQEIYDSNALSKLMTMDLVDDGRGMEYSIYASYISIIALNYGLYSNKLDLNKYGLELFYLMSLYNIKDGSWSPFIRTVTPESNLTTSMMATWALLSWKEAMKKY